MIKIYNLSRKTPPSEGVLQRVYESLATNPEERLIIQSDINSGKIEEYYPSNIKLWNCVRESLPDRDHDIVYVYPENWPLNTAEAWNVIHCRKDISIQELIKTSFNTYIEGGEITELEEWEIL